jgi:hypothetical protein
MGQAMKNTPDAMRALARNLEIIGYHHPAIGKAESMLREIADEMEAANHPEIPDGWKLVPAEPTDRMVEHARTACIAANFYVQGEKTRDPIVQERILLTAAYKAMLSVAPEGGV